jgi:hypothetical protein
MSVNQRRCSASNLARLIVAPDIGRTLAPH